MKLVAMLRIKDQMLTLDECMSKLSAIADEIVVVDNGSTDGTLEAYARYPKIVHVIQTVGFDEGRDKVMAHEAAKARHPDWILWIDADEIFEGHFTREVAERYMRSGYDRVAFRMCNFWMDREHCRYDHEYYLYTLHPQRSMWRNVPAAYFKNVKIHNGDIQGTSGRVLVSPYRLKHYGYADRAKAEQKIATYKRVDPDGSRDYDHTLDRTLRIRRFRFYEFRSRWVNSAYILCYKYTCNLLHLILRIQLKIKKIIAPAAALAPRA